jgi:predicted nucleic acid-binding protein
VRRVLIDPSAWDRLRLPCNVPAPRRAEVAAAVDAGDVFVCLPFLLDAGYAARSAREHSELLCELEALPRASVNAEVEGRALDAQSQLARVGRHRMPVARLMLAAVADGHQLDILHYDADYDIIASKTDLQFGSVWLAKPGSL